jgi:hypothetical protein
VCGLWTKGPEIVCDQIDHICSLFPSITLSMGCLLQGMVSCCRRSPTIPCLPHSATRYTTTCLPIRATQHHLRSSWQQQYYITHPCRFSALYRSYSNISKPTTTNCSARCDELIPRFDGVLGGLGVCIIRAPFSTTRWACQAQP